MINDEPKTPKEFRRYCHKLWRTDYSNGYWTNFIRLVFLVAIFLATICGLNVWLFYKG